MTGPLATATTNADPGSVLTVCAVRLGKPWQVSQAGIEFICGWEAFRSHLYDNDGAGRGGNTTIGFGHLVHMGPISGAPSETPFLQGITLQWVRKLMLNDLIDPEGIVNQRIAVPLFQYEYEYEYEYDALVDFVFNLRRHNEEIVNFINAGYYDSIPAKFMEYTSAGGQHPPGLVKRRRAEGNLFGLGNYDANH